MATDPRMAMAAMQQQAAQPGAIPPAMQRMAQQPVAPSPELPPALLRLAEQAQQLAALPPPQALQMARMLAQQAQEPGAQQFWAETIQRLEATLQAGQQQRGNVVSQTLGGGMGQGGM